MRILVKVGGAQLGEAAERSELASAVKKATAAGHQLIIVHGGGHQIRTLSQRLGLSDRYEAGLRVTDAATAEVVLWVLAGEVNRRLVASLGQAGLSGVGLTGADGGTFSAAPYQLDGVELGYVGQVHSVEPALVETLLSGGHTPVIASVAPLAETCDAPNEQFYNINADHAVAPLASALAAQAILFLSDVPGVIRDGQCVPAMNTEDAHAMVEEGVITAGMQPKVDSALTAARAVPGALVKIASAAGEDSILSALVEGCGTRFECTPGSAGINIETQTMDRDSISHQEEDERHG
ncbi:MAG: acetylglutamate kinase [Planctomycetota bacterium]|jgi:acetylglutamate kinase